MPTFEILEPEPLIEEKDKGKDSWTRFHEDVANFINEKLPCKSMRELDHADVKRRIARRNRKRREKKNRVSEFFADLERQRKL